MAQTLEEFEETVEKPLASGRRISTEAVEAFKRQFRKRLQAFATDVSDVMPTDVEINGYEPIRRSA